MPRFAQIQDERAHWVFEANELFPHAPYVEILDVTGRMPQVNEGDVYERAIDTFTQAPQNKPLAGVQHLSPQGVTNLVLIYFPKAGDAQTPHSHDTFQWFRVIRGSVEVDRDGAKITRTAGEAFIVAANVTHFSTALVDRTILVSLFGESGS